MILAGTIASFSQVFFHLIDLMCCTAFYREWGPCILRYMIILPSTHTRVVVLAAKMACCAAEDFISIAG